MIDHEAILKVLRQKLLTLSVATTGATALSATATGYARVAGSFVTDGFVRGLEVASAGFATNTVSVITDVTALNMAVTRLVVLQNPDGTQTVSHPTMVVEGAAGGRTLTVGLPSLRAWENVRLTPVGGHPYFEEQYSPGPWFVTHDGYAGLYEIRPSYHPRIYAPENTGASARKYADAIVRLFLPGTTMVLPTGEQLIVRGDEPSLLGQLAAGMNVGWSTIPIDVNLKVLTVAIAA